MATDDSFRLSTQEIVAVVGEAVSLQFAATEHFDGNVQITFTIWKFGPTSGSSPVRQLAFAEEHTTTPLPDDPSTPLKRSSSNWVVDLGLPDLRGVLALVTFTVTGRGLSGKQLSGRAVNRLRVPGIVVTSDANLQKIMLHEFFVKSGATYVFDRASVQAIADGLTVAQRKLLATYDIGSRSDRLVVFTTLQPSPTRLMWADACAKKTPTSVRANATFSVFHCRGAGSLVTLLCHTDNMVVNTANQDTADLINSRQGGMGPDKWLSENNGKPPKFLVGSHVGSFTDGVVWSRIFTSKGVDVMPGNSMHGIINTQGCWMLFRNYNWPVARRTDLFRVYANVLRMNKGDKAVAQGLAAVGYDVAAGDEPAGSTDSRDKFQFCDLNYAFNFFFRYVVGIDFFSNEAGNFGRFSNLYETHGMTLANTFPLKEVPSGYLGHDVDQRHEDDHNKIFQPGPAQWVSNAAGFKTADDFLPNASWKNNISTAQLTSMTWADWYVFKPDGVSLSDALASPTSHLGLAAPVASTT